MKPGMNVGYQMLDAGNTVAIEDNHDLTSKLRVLFDAKGQAGRLGLLYSRAGACLLAVQECQHVRSQFRELLLG